jgi:hypothetical protein
VVRVTLLLYVERVVMAMQQQASIIIDVINNCYCLNIIYIYIYTGMFGWTYEYEKIIHERIAYGILWQALPIFIILYKVIPGRSILVGTPTYANVAVVVVDSILAINSTNFGLTFGNNLFHNLFHSTMG